MALSITSIARCGGGTGAHATVTINHEGTARTLTYDLNDIDQMFGELPPPEQLRLLIALWVQYRRQRGRPIIFSAIDPSTEIA